MIELDEDGPQAYPLQWPIGRPRTEPGRRQMAPFRHRGGLVPIAEGVRRLLAEVRRFHATDVVISTNVRPTLSGTPRQETPTGGDPGVAVYFRLKDQPHAMSCDKWSRVADNLAALAAHIEAIRGQLRWGAADVAQVFAGFKALPAMGEVRPWWQVMGFKSDRGITLEGLEAKFAELAHLHHPDRGGNANQMAEITAARAQGRATLAGSDRPGGG